MAPRRRQPRKMVGNTRMDAALDAMRQLGFEENLVRETVEELLDVYEVGIQGYPFIEEGSYKLLIETILSKEQTCVEDKDDTRKDSVAETSSAATPTTGITEVGSSTSQTNDHHHDSAPIGNLEVEADAKDMNEPTERGENGLGNTLESKNEPKPMDNVKESNPKTFVSNVENIISKSSMIESSKTSDKLPHRRRRPSHGWINSDDDNVDLLYFPLPPLPEHTEKLIQKMEAPERRRHKSRWDEKPDDM